MGKALQTPKGLRWLMRGFEQKIRNGDGPMRVTMLILLVSAMTATRLRAATYGMPQDSVRVVWHLPLEAVGSYDEVDQDICEYPGNSVLASGGAGLLRVTADGTVSNMPFSVPGESISADTNGNIYALNSRESVSEMVRVFAPGGTEIDAWGFEGSGDGQLLDPQDIEVGPDGLVYIADSGNHRIQVFQPAGSPIRTWGRDGFGRSDTRRPVSLAFANSNTLYIACHTVAGAKLSAFDTQGNFIRILHERGSSYFCIGVLPTGQILAEGHTRDILSPAGSVDTIVDLSCLPELRNANLNGGPSAMLSNNRFVAAGDDGMACLELTYPQGTTEVGAHPPRPVIHSVSQRPNSTIVDIDYAVVDTVDTNVSVGVLAFLEGGTNLGSVVPMVSLVEGTSANVGSRIATGRRHHLSWDAADAGESFASFEFEILAKDDRDLLGFHFLTIPSNTPDPELTISRSPITHDDLLDCWYWLIATNDPTIRLADDEVRGTSAPYNDVLLASGSETTPNGRAMLFERLRVREATAAELQRLREAETPGDVNQWEPRRGILRPKKAHLGLVLPKRVNEYSFDTGDWGADAWWVVPLE